MYSKAISNFRRDSEGGLVKKSSNVIDFMTGNTFYPEAGPLVEKLKTAHDDFMTAFGKVQNGDRYLIQVKNDKKVVLVQSLTELLSHVNETSKGDRTMLLTTGFDLNREQGSTDLSTILDKLTVDTGKQGQATTSVSKTAGGKCRAYMHQYATEPPTDNTVWTSELTSKRRFTFTKLKSGTQCWFRVIALVAGSQTGASEIVSRFIP